MTVLHKTILKSKVHTREIINNVKNMVHGPFKSLTALESKYLSK